MGTCLCFFFYLKLTKKRTQRKQTENEKKRVILVSFVFCTQIEEKEKQTYSKDQFLLYDKRKSDYGGRLLIFSSDEQLRVLLQSDVLFADGTFRVAPKLFEQFYVIHGFQHGVCKDFFFVDYTYLFM